MYKVSILIPIYKASGFIEKCAESVFSQTFESIEYIFVDDCTPDDSIQKLNQVLERFPHRKNAVTLLQNEKNEGISYSRQRAFDVATADYFLAMDSDDWIEPDMIENLYNKAIETNADMVYSPYFEEYPNGESKIIEPKFSTNKTELIYNALMGFSSYWNKLISRKVMTDNNVKTLEGVSYADDLVVVVKLLYYSARFAEVKNPFYHYVIYNQHSITKKKSNTRHIIDQLLVVQEVERFLKSKPDFEDYTKMLIELKSLRKVRIIRSTFGDAQYLSLFPEINRHIASLPFPLKSKIILKLSAHNQHFLLKNFLKLLGLLRNIVE